jgi:hypothetical protein
MIQRVMAGVSINTFEAIENEIRILNGVPQKSTNLKGYVIDIIVLTQYDINITGKGS